MEIKADVVKQLREKTGAGMMECKRALQETNGDEEAAVDLLRKRGAAQAAKRLARETSEGLVLSYIHPGDKLGVLVEVNCETDFVARNSDFRAFVNDMAMQIAASSPMAVDRTGIPADLIEREKRIYTEQMQESGKPAHVIEKIVEGKLDKFFKENCLLEQAYIKNPDQTVLDYLTEIRAKIGENITVRRFVRYQLGSY